MVPPVDEPVGDDDDPRRPARAPPPVLLACRARLSAQGLRLVGPAKPARRDHLRARRGNARRTTRARRGAGAADPPRDRPRRLSAGRRRRVASSCSIRHAAGRTRTTRGCSRRSPSCDGHTRGSSSCSPRTTGRCRTASARSATWTEASSFACIGRPQRSSFRACTRASASRRSRRWPAVARSHARTSRRCRRSSATRRASSIPSSTEEIVDAVESVLTEPDPWVRRGLERAREFTWEKTARAHDAVYEELGAGVMMSP